MKSRVLPLSAAALLALALTGVAEARNPHCAGGIQYVVQGLRDKDKGNTEDYTREMNKAVAQLEQCAAEDPKDFESLGYLGWAYAELDSAGPAGKAFAGAVKGLESVGDKKKADAAQTNLNHYWSITFNDGIKQIQDAQTAYPDMAKAPENDADKTLRAEASKKYQAAVTSLTDAVLLKPGDPQTIRNIGTAYALMNDFQKAETVLRYGLALAPGDTNIIQSLRTVRTNYAQQLVKEKKFDEAIAYFTDLSKAAPNDADVHLSLADAYFRRANSKEGDAKKPDFASAAAEYQKAAGIKPGDADLPFNAALSYQNAGDWASAEGMWRATLKNRADDVDAISSLAACLAELKKYDEAIQLLCKGVASKPDNKTFHRQLGAVYGKMNNSIDQSEHLMVYLALQNGQPAADVSAAVQSAAAGSAAAATLKSQGNPEQVIRWDFQGDKYESWMYWSKKLAYHFKGGALAIKSDWTRCSGGAPPGGSK